MPQAIFLLSQSVSPPAPPPDNFADSWLIASHDLPVIQVSSVSMGSWIACEGRLHEHNSVNLQRYHIMCDRLPEKGGNRRACVHSSSLGRFLLFYESFSIDRKRADDSMQQNYSTASAGEFAESFVLREAVTSVFWTSLVPLNMEQNPASLL